MRSRDTRLITPGQVKRFNAIAAEFGWPSNALESYLKSRGCSSVEVVQRHMYDSLCADLQNTEIRGFHRKAGEVSNA